MSNFNIGAEVIVIAPCIGKLSQEVFRDNTGKRGKIINIDSVAGHGSYQILTDDDEKFWANEASIDYYKPLTPLLDWLNS